MFTSPFFRTAARLPLFLPFPMLHSAFVRSASNQCIRLSGGQPLPLGPCTLKVEAYIIMAVYEKAQPHNGCHLPCDASHGFHLKTENPKPSSSDRK
ncbi:hypothetical protein U9M48_037825 [Paspalum notatum var. saurae]|uniref:Uncharacterized protein n=1 Tax=Paspalum notatum var. saurae TaxID=547442 RepID=A0AAQ3X9R4_PASNO